MLNHDHTLLDITVHGLDTRDWFCPVCGFTCRSARDARAPSLTDLKRHFVIRLMGIEKEARELGMRETAAGLLEVLDYAGGEIE